MSTGRQLPFGLSKLRRIHLIRLGVALIALFIAIQFIPFGHAHQNPAVVQEPNWDSPQTRELAVAACYDCHSNQTAWRWYTNVAPISWLAQADVNGGRNALNFSEWNQHPERTQRIVRAIQDGSMPPFWYTPMHPNARLSSSKQQALIKGLEATFGISTTHAP